MYERLSCVAQGQILIALPPIFQPKSVQGSLHISSGQQNWPSTLCWLFTVDYQRYSETLQFLTVGTVSTCTKILQIALITLTACFYVHQHVSTPHRYRKQRRSNINWPWRTLWFFRKGPSWMTLWLKLWLLEACGPLSMRYNWILPVQDHPPQIHSSLLNAKTYLPYGC